MANKRLIRRTIIVLIIFLIFLTGCASQNQTARPINNMSLSSKKILMVIAPKDFRDSEYFAPRKIFEENGLTVEVASIQGGTAVGADGATVKIDLTVGQVNARNYDAVVFVGGPGMAQITSDESLQLLVKKFSEAGKLTAAICVAPAILAKAGVLSGKKATSWSGVVDDLKNGGAIYVNEQVVRDGQLITADGPSAAASFAKKIIEVLQ